MSIISILPDHVANQIAAGEVVQRPASVVKELLENAIDAGAKKITLSIVGAGKTSIMVVDNGCGMDEEDARLCFTRHATSKISTADDLFNLNTRGFRGEAMASIAAVSQVHMKTFNGEGSLGWEVQLDGGAITKLIPTPGLRGTTVEVKNLFHNIPARRKFLKNDRIELRHCIDEFQRVALVHTDIHWVMKSEGNVLFQLQPESLRRRISAIFGRKYNERLVPIQEETNVVVVEGFVIKPEFAKKKRGEQFFFVNDRFIKSPYLHNALREAFEDVLTAEHHPGYFLNLKVDPKGLDINIHPTKTEVKFEDERAIYAVLRSAARHAIGQFNVAPTIDFDSEQSFSVPPLPAGHIPTAPKIIVDPTFNPFESTKPSTPRFRTIDQQYERMQQERSLNMPTEFESAGLGDDIASFWDEKSATGQSNEPELELATEPLSKMMVWQGNLLTTLGNRLLIINMKAAQFRIFFDEIWTKLQDSTVPSQQLLFPSELELNNADTLLVEEHLGHLVSSGFDLDHQGNHWVLNGIPVMLSPEEAVPALEQFLEQLHELDENPDSNALLRALALSIAQRASRAGLNTAPAALLTLKEKLLSSSNPQFSPKGEKIIRELNDEQLNAL
ncbi:MAG: mismatch repair endonuclease MutL [Bacteroidota bacterium]|jgi:DNA mismatch repair protein MutL